MRNLTTALGSFVVGALFMFLLGHHTSTVLQPVFAQTAPGAPAGDERPSRWVPEVIPPGIVSHANMRIGSLIDLDGVVSDTEVFRNAKLRYGGGAFILKNTTVQGQIQVEFIGAAANTVTLMEWLGMVGCPAAAPQPEPINPNRPPVKAASLTKPLTGDIRVDFVNAKK